MRIRSIIPAVITCAALLAPVANASANTLTITESGDFTNVSVGSLDVGANTITGSLGGTDVSDLFKVTLPAGLSITSAQVDITNYDQGGGNNFIVPGEYNDPVSNGFQTFFSDTTLNLTFVPFSTPGDFQVELYAPSSQLIQEFNQDINFDGVAPTGPLPGGFNYTITYNVAASTAVPLPPAFYAGLATLALLGVARLTKRQLARAQA